MNDKKKTVYFAPTADLTFFQCSDIITTSGGGDWDWELPIIPDER